MNNDFSSFLFPWNVHSPSYLKKYRSNTRLQFTQYMNMRQIDTRGRIINGNTIISLHPFRISIAAIIISILCLTNPANELSSIQPSNSNKKWNIIQRPTRKYVGSFSFDLFGFEFDLFQSKRYKLFQSDSRLTNYVLFSLDKSDRDGVYIRMLHQKIRLCSYDFDDPFGEVCDWIGELHYVCILQKSKI